MMGATETRLPKKALSLLLALTLAFCLAVPALAAYPDRPENQYVLDEADVLSFLDGEDIDDYAYSLFNIWGIGSQERNNGLLLLLAIGEENYYAQAGTGIEDYFDGAKLQDMLDEYLEPDFAAREYDAGVEKFFQAALSDRRPCPTWRATTPTTPTSTQTPKTAPPMRRTTTPPTTSPALGSG